MSRTGLLVSTAVMGFLAWTYAWGAIPTLPSTSANVVFHLDASDLDGNGVDNGYGEFGLTNGYKVATWADKGSMHANVTQTNDASRPTYCTWGFGANGASRPYLRFTSASTNYLNAITNFSGDQGAVVLVYRSRHVSGGAQDPILVASLPDSQYFLGFAAQANGGYPQVACQDSHGFSAVNGNTAIGYDQVCRTFVGCDGSAWNINHNGATQALSIVWGSSNLGDWFTDITYATDISVGRLLFNSGAHMYFEGDIAEIIVFDSNLDSADLAAVDGYLTQKYFTPAPSGLPSVSANLLFHLDASDLDGNGQSTGLAEGGLTGSNVSTWVNTGSTGFNVKQANAVNMPTYYSSGFGANGSSRPYVRFDAANTNYLDAIAKFTNEQGTVAMVYRSRHVSGTPQHAILTASVPGGSDHFCSFCAEANGGHPDISASSPAHGGNAVDGAAAIGYDQVCRTIISSDGSAWSINHNGATQALSVVWGSSNSGDWFGDISSTHVSVGHFLFSSTRYIFEGDIAEIVVYDAQLNAVDLGKLDYYLARKYFNFAQGTIMFFK